MTWREDVFYPAFAAAGMLVTARVLYAGESVPIVAYVDFSKPDVNPFAGVQSSDYEMEYQRADLPDLAEGDQVEIDGAAYRVRQASRVDGIEATGFFRKATLTKQATDC